jgi:hypothetical protein
VLIPLIRRGCGRNAALRISIQRKVYVLDHLYFGDTVEACFEDDCPGWRFNHLYFGDAVEACFEDDFPGWRFNIWAAGYTSRPHAQSRRDCSKALVPDYYYRPCLTPNSSNEHTQGDHESKKTNDNSI